MCHFTNRLFLKIISFLICAVFVMVFLAADHDRLQESRRKLTCRFDPSSSCWKSDFKTGFPGFSAFTLRALMLPRGQGEAEIELRPKGGGSAASKTVSCAELESSPVQLKFPASDLQEWQLSIRRRNPDRPADGELALSCDFYAGKISRSCYWYGVAAAGVLFIILGAADYFFILRKKPEQTGKPARKTGFDYGIHYFRALAIFFIMILHYSFLSPDLKCLNQTMFSSASYFFVFISGYLFYYLTGSFEVAWSFSKSAPFLQAETVSGKFSVPGYYKKKILNILLPYFLIASTIYLYIWLYSDTAQLVPAVPGTWQDYFFRIRTGSVQRSHWYIYFISKVFLISPLLLFLPKRCFAVLTAASCVLPFVFTRTESHFCYFLPMYLLGMAYARYRVSADRILYHPAVKIVVTVLAIAGLVYLYPGREEQDGLIFAVRVLMTADLLYITNYLSRWKLPWLSFCADISFTLFFIHDFVFAGLVDPVRVFYAPVCRAMPVLELLAPMTMISAVMVLAWALKNLFGSFSRRMIGS